jgi:hypothetical protein
MNITIKGSFCIQGNPELNEETTWSIQGNPELKEETTWSIQGNRELKEETNLVEKIPRQL